MSLPGPDGYLEVEPGHFDRLQSRAPSLTAEVGLSDMEKIRGHLSARREGIDIRTTSGLRELDELMKRLGP